jgi:t-SNARE complex subunit (syntaxin)
LEEVSVYIDQLYHKALIMEDEMEKQSTMLETVGENAAKAKAPIQRANQQINRLLSASDKGKIICIFILIIIIVIIIGIIMIIN